MVRRTRYHIGLRTVKTALAVSLALTLAHLRGGDAIPIFAAIGAISVMTRRLSDAKNMAREQAIGTLLGATSGFLLLLLPMEWRILGIGIGLMITMPLCFPLRIPNAVPLTAIVFVSIAIFSVEDGSPLLYVCNRYLDTFIGLSVGFLVNFLIKPYHNRTIMTEIMCKYAAQFPDLIAQRVVQGHYPDLLEIAQSLRLLQEEMNIFDAQFRTQHSKQKGESVYLHGCLQLCERMYTELATLCNMDFVSAPNAENLQALEQLQINVCLPVQPSADLDSVVLNYHLKSLLDAYNYLLELLHSRP